MLTDLDYELLSAYIDGALTDSERAAFEMRLQAEPELSRELDELRATVTLLNNLPPRKAPRDFTLDARYVRRSTFFFTSATFSALSTAAAIILFAVGAYLFTGSKNAPTANGVVSQDAQSAFVPSPTSPTMDKAAATTATITLETDQFQNMIQTTAAPENSPTGATELAVPGGLAQESVTVESSGAADQSTLTQANVAQSTNLPADGTISGGAPMIAPSSPGNQGRTSEATETITTQQYAAPSSSNSTGGAIPPSPAEETLSDASAASSVFAATQQLSTPTSAASSTPAPTLTLTLTPSPTNTLTLTPTVTPLPTVSPEPAVVAVTSDSLPLLLIGLGIVLLLIAIGTTLMRRRNRP